MTKSQFAVIDSIDWRSEINRARDRLQGQAHVTPVMTCKTLDAMTGTRVWLKCENFQRTGAFKFRGAFNALSALDKHDRMAGVITHSSGNHAQALACAGALLGVHVTVVMPGNAPVIKRTATAGYGGEVIEYDPLEQNREELSARIARERGLILIPPYDHPHVIAGQATAAAELLEQVGRLDWIVTPTGGGGLLSGSALSCHHYDSNCRVAGVEPSVADDATRSFRTGELHTVHNPPTIADGVRTPSLGRWTFPLVRKHVDDMITVSEASIVAAVHALFSRAKLVVEPSGALGLAALLSGSTVVSGNVGVILSGGNLDPAAAADLFAD